jgi:flagellar assembly factor FliW
MSPSAALKIARSTPSRTSTRASTIHSDILGDIPVREGETLYFPSGLLGFPDCRSFVLLAGARDGLYWLQSTDSTTLVFLLVDPFVVIDGCAIDVPQTQLGEIGGGNPSEVVVLSIVTLPRNPPEHPTANLQAPVVINLRTRLARQIICSEGDLGIRCPFDLSRAMT